MDTPKPLIRRVISDVSVLYFIVIIIFAIYLGLSSFIQSNYNDKENSNRRKNANYNLIVDSVHQDRNLFPKESPAYKLINDLNLFLKSNPNSNLPFAPQSLSDIVIPPGVYPGLDNQVGCVVNHGTDNICDDYGMLQPEFVIMFSSANNTTDLTTLYRKTQPTDNRLFLYPFGLAWYEVPFILLLVINLISCISFNCTAPKRVWNSNTRQYEEEPTKLTLKRVPKITFFFLAHPLFWIALLNDVKQSKLQKHKLYIAEQDELNRIKNHPLAGELFSAQEKRKTLLNFAILYPKSAEIAEALAECEEVIKELETFPDILSEKSAKYVALQVIDDLKNTRSIVSTRLNALDEIQKL